MALAPIQAKCLYTVLLLYNMGVRTHLAKSKGAIGMITLTLYLKPHFQARTAGEQSFGTMANDLIG
jgi:hypothetical protein